AERDQGREVQGAGFGVQGDSPLGRGRQWPCVLRNRPGGGSPPGAKRDRGLTCSGVPVTGSGRHSREILRETNGSCGAGKLTTMKAPILALLIVLAAVAAGCTSNA